MAGRPLTPKQQRFIDEYLVDLNASQAAIRAGYSARRADAIGYENLRKPEIAAAIRDAQAARSERTGITADRVLAELWSIATADYRELVQVKVGCCRHCYGEGNRYQRTVGEMNRDRELFVAKGGDLIEFDEAGGIGFDPLREPNKACPECGGDGHSRVVLADTRNVSKAAASLFAGAKQTRDGIEVKFHAKLDAIEKLARHLGVYEADNRQKGVAAAEFLRSIQPNLIGVSNGAGAGVDAD